jgi:hypothetical protein
VVFSTNKTDFHEITEILLKVALNTINQTIAKDSTTQTPLKRGRGVNRGQRVIHLKQMSA